MCRSTHLPFTCILCPYNHSDLRSHYKRILIIHLCSSLLSTSIYMINRDDLFIIMLLLLLLGVCLLSISSPSLFLLLIVWCDSRLCWHGYFYLCSCFFCVLYFPFANILYILSCSLLNERIKTVKYSDSFGYSMLLRRKTLSNSTSVSLLQKSLIYSLIYKRILYCCWR